MQSRYESVVGRIEALLPPVPRLNQGEVDGGGRKIALKVALTGDALVLRKLGLTAALCSRQWKLLVRLSLPFEEDPEMLLAEAIVAFIDRNLDDVERLVDMARGILDTRVTVGVAENMDRAAPVLLQLQLGLFGHPVQEHI